MVSVVEWCDSSQPLLKCSNRIKVNIDNVLNFWPGACPTNGKRGCDAWKVSHFRANFLLSNLLERGYKLVQFKLIADYPRYVFTKTSI